MSFRNCMKMNSDPYHPPQSVASAPRTSSRRKLILAMLVGGPLCGVAGLGVVLWGMIMTQDIESLKRTQNVENPLVHI